MTTPPHDPAYLAYDHDHEHEWQLFAMHVGQMIGIDAVHIDVHWCCTRCGRMRTEHMGTSHLSITIETVKEEKKP